MTVNAWAGTCNAFIPRHPAGESCPGLTFTSPEAMADHLRTVHGRKLDKYTRPSMLTPARLSTRPTAGGIEKVLQKYGDAIQFEDLS